MDATCVTGIAYPSGAHEFISCFLRGLVSRSLVICSCIVFCRKFLSSLLSFVFWQWYGLCFFGIRFWLGSWNLLSYLDFFFVYLELLFWWNGEISRNNKNWKTFISCQWRFLKLYFPKWKHMSDLWSECVLLFCHFSSSSVVVITVFTVFRLLTDFVFLYTYAFWLSLC